MFKKIDYIIMSIICVFLGIFIVSQFYSAKEYQKVTQPENNEVLALEVAKLTSTNADLRREVTDLTNDLDDYRASSESRKATYEKYVSDTEKLDIINGSQSISGQGIVVKIDGELSTAQIVDLINAIKNIGAEVIAVNNQRLMIDTDLSAWGQQKHYEIKVLGNSNLLKSAMERKGGIVEQISDKNVSFNIIENENIEIGTGKPLELKYSHILEEVN